MLNHHRAWRLHAPKDLRLDEVPTPAPAEDGVLVRIEAAMVLSYTGKLVDGSLPYALPKRPFTPGSNAIGTVEAVGAGVLHLEPGARVFVSPHLVANERADAPAQILIGLTAMGAGSSREAAAPESLALQRTQVTPELLKLREVENQRAAIAKWNGVLPTTTYGQVPLIGIAAAAAK